MPHTHLPLDTAAQDALGPNGLAALYETANAGIYSTVAGHLTVIRRSAAVLGDRWADALTAYLPPSEWVLEEATGYSYGDCGDCLFTVEDFALAALARRDAEIITQDCGWMVTSSVIVG